MRWKLSARTTRAWSAVGLVCAPLLARCGGPSGGVPPTRPTASTSALASASVVADDLTPVPPPPNAVAIVRVAGLPTLVAQAASWFHEPPPDVERFVVREALGLEAAHAPVDVNAPIDCAFAAQVAHGRRSASDQGVACALAVADPELRPDEVERLFEGSARFSRAEPRLGGGRWMNRVDERRSSDVHCAVLPSAGASRSRLVCGTGRDDVLRLGPYLARTLAAAPAPSTLHAELLVPATQKLLRDIADELPDLLRGITGSNGPLASFTRDKLGGLATGFVDDLSVFTLDLALDDRGATLTMATELGARRGPVSRLLTAHPERAEAAPKSFARLPADTDAAAFHRGFDGPEAAMIVVAARAALEDASRDDKLPSADRGALLDALIGIGELALSPMSYGRGVDRAAAELACRENDVPREADARLRCTDKLAGWSALAIERPPSTVLDRLAALVAVAQRPFFVASRKSDPTLPRLTLSSVKVVDLPAGTNELVLELPRAPAPAPAGKAKPKKPRSAELHVLVVPEGDHTLLVSAAERTVAVEHARALLRTNASASKPVSPTPPPATLGGFFTLDAVDRPTPLLTLIDERDWLPRAAPPGTDPIQLRYTPTAASPSAPGGGFRLAVWVSGATVAAALR